MEKKYYILNSRRPENIKRLLEMGNYENIVVEIEIHLYIGTTDKDGALLKAVMPKK